MFSIINRHKLQGYLCSFGDVPKTCFPCRHGLACSFGKDGQHKSFVGVKQLHHLCNHIVMTSAIDRYCTKESQQLAEQTFGISIRNKPRSMQSCRHHHAQVCREIPPRCMWCHDTYKLGSLGDLAFSVPATHSQQHAPQPLADSIAALGMLFAKFDKIHVFIFLHNESPTGVKPIITS